MLHQRQASVCDRGIIDNRTDDDYDARNAILILININIEKRKREEKRREEKRRK